MIHMDCRLGGTEPGRDRRSPTGVRRASIPILLGLAVVAGGRLTISLLLLVALATSWGWRRGASISMRDPGAGSTEVRPDQQV